MTLLKMKKFTISLLLLLFFSPAFAQKGLVKGTILDGKTAETLIGTTVLIQGTTIGTITDFDGNFLISAVDPGTYNLVISFVSYETQIQKIEVAAGKETVLEIRLQPVSLDIGEVKVVARKRTNTEMSLLSTLKTNDLIVSGISAQQISKSQDKDAAEVIRRVPGITITDGRFVVVRGLIERYNTVMLNNATAPSFEADKRAFSFDAIPSGLIDNILIYKSPAPELPADFAGAAIDVQTKNAADENSFELSYGLKYSENATFNNNFLKHEGSPTDWLGWDNGYRNIPAGVPATDVFTKLYNWQDLAAYQSGTAELTRISNLFKNNWSTFRKTPFFDQNASATLLRRFTLGKVSVGNVTSFNWNLASEYLEIVRREYQDYDAEREVLHKDFDFDDARSKQTAKMGLIHNWNFIYGKNQKLEFRNFLNQTGVHATSVRDGVNYYNVETLRLFDLKFESRFVYSGQLAGEQLFANDRTRLNWMAGYAFTNRKQPDNRRLTWVQNLDPADERSGEYALRIQNVPNAYMAGRLWIDMAENITDGKIDLTHHFSLFNAQTPWQLKAGLFHEQKKRDFNSRLIGAVAVSRPPDIFYNPVEQIFSSENLYFDQTAPYTEHGIAYRDNTREKDNYNATDQLTAGYVGLKIPFSPRLYLYGGIRAEKWNRLITGFYPVSDEVGNLDIVRDTLNLFPSANLVYNFNEKNQLRLSYGKTVNRPEFREMSNFDYQDFDLFALIHGNEELQNAYIHHFDFRYEWYPSAGETVSLAAFYKTFQNPVEVFLIPAGTGYDYKPFNTGEAHSMGLELDVRKSLAGLETAGSGLVRFFKDLTVVFNASAISSKINTEKQAFAREKERIMQGQSPYIVNVGLFYQKNGTNMSLSYNNVGKRIAYVGTPVNPHTWELSRNSLDLTLQKNIGKRVQLKAGIKDLLNEPVQFVQYYGEKEEITAPTLQYRPNRQYSLSLTVNL